MKTIMFVAPASHSGKTTVTAGIIRALSRAGHQVRCLKTGPDYIDTAFLSKASGMQAGNLDMHLMGISGMRRALQESFDLHGHNVNETAAKEPLCIIEGAMGYFDGIGNTYNNSSFDIGKKLGIPAVLIYSPKGEMFSAVPKIKGMVDFSEGMIKAVIFNNTSEKMYKMLSDALCSHTNLSVLGYIPLVSDAVFESRHLGLIQCRETERIDEKIDAIASAVKKSIDLAGLRACMPDIPSPLRYDTPYAPLSDLRSDRTDPADGVNKRITVGIAYDEAFSFIYTENLRLFEKYCRTVFFSPLRDPHIPDCDLLYFPGGYPEVFAQDLSRNISMRASIRSFADNNGCVYGECGGLMYLTSEIDGYPMAGVFNGKILITKTLQNFGYVQCTINRPCLIGTAGDVLSGHEFHRSTADISSPAVYTVRNTGNSTSWSCGYAYKNVFGAFAHIHFYDNMKAFHHMIGEAAKCKCDSSD